MYSHAMERSLDLIYMHITSIFSTYLTVQIIPIGKCRGTPLRAKARYGMEPLKASPDAFTMSAHET